MGVLVRVCMAVRMRVHHIAMPVLMGMDMSVGMLMDMLMGMAVRMVVRVTVIGVVHLEASLTDADNKAYGYMAAHGSRLNASGSILTSNLTSGGSRDTFMWTWLPPWMCSASACP